MSELLKLQEDQALVHPAQCVLGGRGESCCRHDGPIPAPVESRQRVRLVGRTKTTGITSPAGGESCSVRRSAREGEGRGRARESQERRVPPLVPVTPNPSGRAPHLRLHPPARSSLSAQGGFHLPPPDTRCGAAGEGGGGELSPAPPAAAAAAAATNAARSGKGYFAPPPQSGGHKGV